MEHALRHHIHSNYQRDPVLYKKLSERLEEILKQFEDNWTEQVRALGELKTEARGEYIGDDTGLDPQTEAPFFRILREAIAADRTVTNEQFATLQQVTVQIVAHIRTEIIKVGFWQNTFLQNVLRKDIVQLLDQYNLMPYESLLAVADRIVDLARARHLELTT
jgi:type I restriction enzyme R subunit